MVLENGYLGKLRWLEYNLKRALSIEGSDEEEQKLGATHEESIPKLRYWLNNEIYV